MWANYKNFKNCHQHIDLFRIRSISIQSLYYSHCITVNDFGGWHIREERRAILHDRRQFAWM